MGDSLIHWFIADNYHETFWDISLCSTFTGSPTFLSKLCVNSPAYIPNFGMYLCVQFVEIPQNHFDGSDTTECPAGPVLVGSVAPNQSWQS